MKPYLDPNTGYFISNGKINDGGWNLVIDHQYGSYSITYYDGETPCVTYFCNECDKELQLQGNSFITTHFKKRHPEIYYFFKRAGWALHNEAFT
jgi:hypothetical protein